MTIFQQLINAAQFHITGGSAYQWNCFGSHARFLDFNSSVFPVDFAIIFDAVDQKVYQSYMYINDCAYRWTHPQFLDSFRQECFARNIDPRIAFDNIAFIDCVMIDDFIGKVKDGFSTGQCDNSILISLKLTPKQEHIFSQLPKGTTIESFIMTALTEKLCLVSEQHIHNWDIVFSALHESGISASINVEDAPISDNNIQAIYNWINSLDLDNVALFYSDKDTASGILSILTVKQKNVPDIHFQYYN